MPTRQEPYRRTTACTPLAPRSRGNGPPASAQRACPAPAVSGRVVVSAQPPPASPVPVASGRTTMKQRKSPTPSTIATVESQGTSKPVLWTIMAISPMGTKSAARHSIPMNAPTAHLQNRRTALSSTLRAAARTLPSPESVPCAVRRRLLCGVRLHHRPRIPTTIPTSPGGGRTRYDDRAHRDRRA